MAMVFDQTQALEHAFKKIQELEDRSYADKVWFSTQLDLMSAGFSAAKQEIRNLKAKVGEYEELAESLSLCKEEVRALRREVRDLRLKQTHSDAKHTRNMMAIRRLDHCLGLAPVPIVHANISSVMSPTMPGPSSSSVSLPALPPYSSLSSPIASGSSVDHPIDLDVD